VNPIAITGSRGAHHTCRCIVCGAMGCLRHSVVMEVDKSFCPDNPKR